MDINLRAQLRTESRWLSGLALFSENFLSLFLIQTILVGVILTRPTTIEGFILPTVAGAIAVASIFSARLSRLRSKSLGRVWCALPVGVNRLCLIVAAAVLLQPIQLILNGTAVGPVLDQRILQVASSITLLVGLCQLGVALCAGFWRTVFEPLMTRSLHAVAAAIGLLVLMPQLLEHLPMVLLMGGLLLMQRLSLVPLPFRVPAPLAAFVLATIIALSSGAAEVEPTGYWPGMITYLQELMAQPRIQWLGWQGLAGDEGFLLKWLPAMLLFAFQAAVLDLALAYNAFTPTALDDVQEPDIALARQHLLGLGLINVVFSFFGLIFPIQVLVGHRAYRSFESGSAYIQLAGLGMLALFVSGLLSPALQLFPAWLWAPGLAYLYVATFAFEAPERPGDGPALLGAALPLVAGFLALVPTVVSLWSKSTTTLSPHQLSPLLHVNSLALLGQGCVLVSLLWSGIAFRIAPIVLHSPILNVKLGKDRSLQLQRAAVLSLGGFFASCLGLIHSSEISLQFDLVCTAYLGLAVLLHWTHIFQDLRLKTTADTPATVEAESIPQELQTTGRGVEASNAAGSSSLTADPVASE